MFLKKVAMASAVSFAAIGAYAGCAFENTVPLKSLTAGFEAWKAVTDAMAECGNFEADLDRDFRLKQPEAFAANPSLYNIGGVANSTLIPLLEAGTIRPLDELIAAHGSQLKPNQLIKIDGHTMAVAMMVNNQHLMYREDILNDLGIAVPTTYAEVLAEAAFRVAMEGIDTEMVTANNDAAVWLIEGYVPGELAAGAAATAAAGALPYPASGAMGLMHTALGDGIADYLTGAKDAETTLADIEAACVTAAKEAGLIQ